jgi:hypothetical protein
MGYGLWVKGAKALALTPAPFLTNLRWVPGEGIETRARLGPN